MKFTGVLCFFVIIVFGSTSGFFRSSFMETGINAVRKSPRWIFSWYTTCNGCPAKSCEDDEAIIHGYCCGCAHAFDKLPVMCPKFLQCPLNLQGLCHDYEYMISCCC